MKVPARQKRGKKLGRIAKLTKKLKERKDRGRAPENK